MKKLLLPLLILLSLNAHPQEYTRWDNYQHSIDSLMKIQGSTITKDQYRTIITYKDLGMIRQLILVDTIVHIRRGVMAKDQKVLTATN